MDEEFCESFQDIGQRIALTYLKKSPLLSCLRRPGLQWSAIAALALAGATGTTQAQITGFYARASVNHQNFQDVALKDNRSPGPGSWFGFGEPGNPFGFVVPGNPDEGTKFPLKNSWGGGAALGYRVSPMWRFDVSFDRSASSTLHIPYPSFAPVPGEEAKFTFRSTQFMGNVTLDLGSLLPAEAQGPIQPYVTAGLGLSRNKNGDYRCNSLNSCTALSYDNSNTNNDFAWQAGLGLLWQLTPAMAMDFGYRHVDMGSTRGASVQTPIPAWGLHGNVKANRLTAGIVYSFGSK